MTMVTNQNQGLTGGWRRRYTGAVVVNCSLTALGKVAYGAKKCASGVVRPYIKTHRQKVVVSH